MLQKLVKLSITFKSRGNLKAANLINALIVAGLNPISRNYDYDVGPYVNMDKYKSIGEYLKQRHRDLAKMRKKHKKK